ncbi:hypothetical protein C8R46DRAFT_1065094 [Mycena filopes]|nr:hypothetical protein C8R46DRAFT_1065094 [Mycena filopes]
MPPQHNSHQVRASLPRTHLLIVFMKDYYSGRGAGQVCDMIFIVFANVLSDNSQAPGAPRFVNVPLPQPNSFASWGAPPVPAQSPSDDVFPIDLTNPVDFHRLARVLDNVSISEHATVYVYPPSRDRCLLQVPMQGRRLTTFSFIQYLHTTMSKPLTRHDFTTLLSTTAQHEVHRHFLAKSRNGEQLWDGFVRGVRASRGPKGVVLLQGHHCLWGFSQDQHGQWIMDVDVPATQEVQLQGHQFQRTLDFSYQ